MFQEKICHRQAGKSTQVRQEQRLDKRVAGRQQWQRQECAVEGEDQAAGYPKSKAGPSPEPMAQSRTQQQAGRP